MIFDPWTNYLIRLFVFVIRTDYPIYASHRKAEKLSIVIIINNKKILILA
jgi:hypothetical protein